MFLFKVLDVFLSFRGTRNLRKKLHTVKDRIVGMDFNSSFAILVPRDDKIVVTLRFKGLKTPCYNINHSSGIL
jgi:hypothetical protein